MGRLGLLLAVFASQASHAQFENHKVNLAGMLRIPSFALPSSFNNASSILIPKEALKSWTKLKPIQIPVGDGYLPLELNKLSPTGSIDREKLLKWMERLTDSAVALMAPQDIRALYQAIRNAYIPGEGPSIPDVESKLLGLNSEMNELNKRINRSISRQPVRGIMHGY